MATLPRFDTLGTSRAIQAIGGTTLLAAAVGLIALGSLDLHPNPLFHPHGYCYLWEKPLVAAHVVSDGVIGGSYYAISAALAYLVYRARRDIPFGWMVLTFGAFIIACGSTHLMEVITLWKPLFWTAADIKIVTAVASVLAALSLPPLVPRVLALAAAAKLAEARRIALQEANDLLERRVAERTAELELTLAREHELRERAEAANLVKDEFLSIVSHELRTPLNAILGWSTMLGRESLEAATQRRAAASIDRNARSLAQLVDDLLDVSRVVTGKLRIRRDPVALAPVVAAGIDTVRHAADAKRIVIAFNDGVPGATICGDEHRLQQIVWNLLSNAVKFTPEGGTIAVDLKPVGPRVALVVCDSGIGIDAAFLPHVFERFTQADSSPTRSHSGLGLGLAVVRHLVELHGGTVTAASDGRGKGATFTVELPRIEV